MAKKGPKPSVTHEERVIELKNHIIFDEKGYLKKESDLIWDIICQNLSKSGKIIKKRNLYTYISRNLKKIKEDLNLEKQKENSLIDEAKDGCNYDSTIEENLLALQTNVLFKPVIKEVCIHPVVIFHWSVNAIDFSTELTSETVFYFGRIGSFCQQLSKSDGSQSDSIYLYSLGVSIENKVISLCHVTTERNSQSLFYRFFF